VSDDPDCRVPRRVGRRPCRGARRNLAVDRVRVQPGSRWKPHLRLVRARRPSPRGPGNRVPGVVRCAAAGRRRPRLCPRPRPSATRGAVVGARPHRFPSREPGRTRAREADRRSTRSPAADRPSPGKLVRSRASTRSSDSSSTWPGSDWSSSTTSTGRSQSDSALSHPSPPAGVHSYADPSPDRRDEPPPSETEW
jgi:hypothetical protein